MSKYLRRPAVCERYDVACSTLYHWMANGRFPKPVRLGLRVVAWSIEDLEAWERARKDEQDKS